MHACLSNPANVLWVGHLRICLRYGLYINILGACYDEAAIYRHDIFFLVPRHNDIFLFPDSLLSLRPE